MSEINLLKDYIKTLESENQAKNSEREKLYQQLSSLSDQNDRLIHDLNSLQVQLAAGEQAQYYIMQLQNDTQCMRADLDNLVQILHERDSEISNISYQREKDTQRINDLQAYNKELRKGEARLREELVQMKQQYRIVVARLEECAENTKLNQLVENYEKIEELARERNIENDELRYQKDNLMQEVDHLKKMLQAKDNEIKMLKKNVPKKQEPVILKKEQFTTISLIRQNNKLIQRVTELEKQKNSLYIEALDNHWKLNDSDSINPLRIRLTFNTREGDSKIRQKIQTIKTANETLLQNLKI